MSDFTFICHEAYPEDAYIEESVVLCISQRHRVTYVRKKMKNGGKFWDVISAAVKKDGVNKYLKSYAQDSNFLRDDIMKFLESRSWEACVPQASSGAATEAPGFSAINPVANYARFDDCLF